MGFLVLLLYRWLRKRNETRIKEEDWHAVHRVAHAVALQAADKTFESHEDPTWRLPAWAGAYLDEHDRLCRMGAACLSD